MQFRSLAVLLSMVFATACASAVGSRPRAAQPADDTFTIPVATPALAALCRRPAMSFEQGRTLLDTIARELTNGGTAPGAYAVERLPRKAGARIASFAMRGDTAVISISDTVGGHSLYHELVHAWAARLAPAPARALVESVFAADRLAEWEPEVTLWASASYLSVVNGLARPDGLTTMSLSVTASALDTARAGRLTRLFDATAPIVRRARLNGSSSRTVADALETVARAHWQYAGHRPPRGWNGEAERRFILASEVLAYARERQCLRR